MLLVVGGLGTSFSKRGTQAYSSELHKSSGMQLWKLGKERMSGNAIERGD